MVGYLVPESTIKVKVCQADPLTWICANSYDITITDTAPAIKGSTTASAQVKPATLETGLVVSVPPSTP